MTQVTTEKLYQHRPKAQGITIRRLQFNPKAIRRHYFANSPVMSHLLCLLLFPSVSSSLCIACAMYVTK